MIKILTLILTFSILFIGCERTNQPKKENIDVKSEKHPVIKKIIKPKEIKKVVHTPNKLKKNNAVKSTPPKIVTKKTVQAKVKKTILSYPPQSYERTSSIATKQTIKNFDFDIIKKGYKDNNTLLIVGGIQGDEPGGFMAASLLATHYTITKGSVWIVPNLNFYSIIKRSRGPFGDMNRKFAYLDKKDPDYKSIQRIKKYMTSDNVKLIVNLHDGSGFYRPKYIDRWHQPLTWGQSSVIDQEILPNNIKYGNSLEISEQVVNHINKHLLKSEDIYRTKNTHTRLEKTYEEQEMAKTLTYFAIKNGKAAFGHETSKSLNVEQRVYYKLLALEKYMDIMGIEYKRKFNLEPAVIKNIFDNDIEISLYDGKIKLPLSKIRNILKYFPIKKDGTIDFISSNPLMSIIKNKNIYTIYYGNRRISRLKADYTAHTSEQKSIKLNIDSKDENITFGSLITVKNNFKVYDTKDYRVNVIGFTTKSKKETDTTISYNKMRKKFSIDKKGSTYRIEFYKQEKFAGMILVKFTS